MEKIRVLIVDDSAFMRKLLQDFLSADPRLEVAGTARNGHDALSKVKLLKPDVVTLDVEMPVLDGVEALTLIMEENPVPVIMVSSSTAKGAETTLRAIQKGAVDFVAKPSGSISLDLHKIKDDLIEKVVLANKANLRSMGDRTESLNQPRTMHKSTLLDEVRHIKEKPAASFSGKKLVCIGSSTGGPRVLQKVLSKLPKSFGAPVLVVQHMPPGFTRSLANRLDSFCQVNVKEAESGELLKDGTVYIAPGGFHLKAVQKKEGLTAELSEMSPRNGHRPSVDVLSESVSQLNGVAAVAVILTGMGSDGALGLEALSKTTALRAIAESEESAVIFGMPKAAIATGIVDIVSHNEQIAYEMMNYIETRGKS